MKKTNFFKRNEGITTGVLIVILVIAIIVVGTLAYLFIFKKGSTILGKNEDKVKNLNAPQITLEANEDTEEVIEVKIKAVATTEDDEGIKGIRLPNGTEINADEYEYKVTKNGSYTFYAIGNNGEETSEVITISNIVEASASTPYIPEGFTYVEGEPDTGYVIKDKYENQFVWVPVPSGILTRDTNFSADYEETTGTSTELVNSVANYYGFYIGRYEASKSAGNRVAVIESEEPWTNITYTKAEEYSKKMSEDYRYEEDVKTSIINSYAWDTTLVWLNEANESYSTKLDYGNYSGQLAKTGETESDKVNNIYDLAGNVREWTSEIYKKVPKTTPANTTNNTQNTEVATFYRVVRGGSATIAKTAASHTGYSELQSDSYWGFRVILYKSLNQATPTSNKNNENKEDKNNTIVENDDSTENTNEVEESNTISNSIKIQNN